MFQGSRIGRYDPAPVGIVFPYAGQESKVPQKYLLCTGQAVSRSQYAVLFDVIGTAYGAGDGSTTFNVPDFRGRTMNGADAMGGGDQGRTNSFKNRGDAKTGNTENSSNNGTGVSTQNSGTGASVNSNNISEGQTASHVHSYDVYDSSTTGSAGDTGASSVGTFIDTPSTNNAGSDNSHGHGFSDPGHNHNMNDPGHSHNTDVEQSGLTINAIIKAAP